MLSHISEEFGSRYPWEHRLDQLQQHAIKCDRRIIKAKVGLLPMPLEDDKAVDVYRPVPGGQIQIEYDRTLPDDGVIVMEYANARR